MMMDHYLNGSGTPSPKLGTGMMSSFTTPIQRCTGSSS